MVGRCALTTIAAPRQKSAYLRLRQAEQKRARVLDQALLAKLPASVQLAAQDAQAKGYRLFVKDVLHVGDWDCDDGTDAGETWHVDQQEIRRLNKAHEDYRDAGNSPINLTWDHSDSSRDTCGDILATWAGKGGDWLYSLIGTKDAKAAKALENGMPVSIQANPKHKDGAGNKYPIAMTHVALCQRPVVTNQAPAKRLLSKAKVEPRGDTGMAGFWKRLAQRLGTTEKKLVESLPPAPRRRLADSPFPPKKDADADPDADPDPETTPEDDGPSDEENFYGVDPKATEVDIPTLVKFLNECEDLGLSDKIQDWGQFVVGCEGGDESEDEPDDDDPSMDPGSTPAALAPDAAAGLAGPTSFSQPGSDTTRKLNVKTNGAAARRLAQVEQQNAELREQLAQRKAADDAKAVEERKARRLSFTKQLDQLCEEGKITAADRPEWLAAGKEGKWNPIILAPLRLAAAVVPTRRLSKSSGAATTTNPAGEPKVYTDEERKVLKMAAKNRNMGGESILRTTKN